MFFGLSISFYKGAYLKNQQVCIFFRDRYGTERDIECSQRPRRWSRAAGSGNLAWTPPGVWPHRQQVLSRRRSLLASRSATKSITESSGSLGKSFAAATPVSTTEPPTASLERLEEFGEAYFNLSQLMPIQPSGYRELVSSVTANTIELDGRKIPITPENAPHIIEAVRELRSRLDREQSKSRLPFSALQNRLDLCHSELAGAIRRGLGKTEGSILIAVLTDAISRFEEASIKIAEANL